MVQFSQILVTYFVIGAVMWGGGAIAWGETGLVGQFIEDPGGPNSQVEANQQTGDQLARSGGPIQEAAQSVGGSGLLAVWNIVAGIIGFAFWPVGVLVSVDAPPRLIVLAGGSMSTAFVAGVIRLYISGD
jgi:hypothetical protein